VTTVVDSLKLQLLTSHITNDSAVTVAALKTIIKKGKGNKMSKVLNETFIFQEGALIKKGQMVRIHTTGTFYEASIYNEKGQLLKTVNLKLVSKP
jgi:hypothetical protein